MVGEVSQPQDRAMNDFWACGKCRSVNLNKVRRCYTCQTPRAIGEMPEAAAAMRSAAAVGAVSVIATVTRAGARYRPSWPIAIPVVVLIIAATVLTIVQVDTWTRLVGSNGRIIAGPATLQSFTNLSIATFAAYAAALVLWSGWIAIVVGNVPALTGRWPSRTPVGAFLAAFIPFIGLKRPHSVVDSVLAILGGGRALPRAIALAWWAAVLATYFVPAIIVVTGRSGRYALQTAASAIQVGLLLLIPAAILAIAVIVVVEREQAAAVRRREATVFAVGAMPA